MMSGKKAAIIIALCCFVNSLFGQLPADTSTQSKNLPSVEIRSFSTIPPSLRTTSLSYALERNKGNTLTEVLQENSGVYLKNYGQGMLSTISFRGTGAEHTALVWGGITINYPVLGLADFSTIPAGAFNNVGLLHGSSSTFFGSSAIGGTIHIDNEKPFSTSTGFADNKIQTTASFEGGSYGRYYGNISNYISTPKFSSRTTALWLDAANNFNFINTTKLTKLEERQINSAISQRAFLQDFSLVTGQRSYASLKAWYNYTDRQIPPTLTSANSAAYQLDESIRLVGEWVSLARGITTLRAAFVKDFIGYDDVYLSSASKMSTTTVQANHTFTLPKSFYLQAGVEGQFFTADIEDYNGFKTEWRASAFVVARYEPAKRYALSAGYRQILVQGFKTAAAPNFGVTYKVWKDRLLLKASASRSYRVPTLNERYWVPGGNPDLKAEGGWSYEAGVAYKQGIKNWQLNAEFTGFAMHVNNWLQWQPTNLGYWVPMNLKQVLSRGAEVATGAKYEKDKFSLRADVAYALAIATNQKTYTGLQDLVGKDLIYTPRHVASAGLTLSYAGFSFFANAQYTGLRYTATDNLQSVDGYWLLNARLSKSFKINNSLGLSVFVQAYNLANSSYFNLPYRPMPLRNYRAGLSITFEKPFKNKYIK